MQAVLTEQAAQMVVLMDEMTELEEAVDTLLLFDTPLALRSPFDVCTLALETNRKLILVSNDALPLARIPELAQRVMETLSLAVQTDDWLRLQLGLTQPEPIEESTEFLSEAELLAMMEVWDERERSVTGSNDT